MLLRRPTSGLPDPPPPSDQAAGRRCWRSAYRATDSACRTDTGRRGLLPALHCDLRGGGRSGKRLPRHAAPRPVARRCASPADTHVPAAAAHRIPRSVILCLDLQIGQGDRLVDLVREGIDCVIRAVEIADSGLIMRRLGMVTGITCASPAYIERHGIPHSPDAIDGHRAVGFISSRTGQIMPLEFTVGSSVRYVTLPCRLTVNNSDTMNDLALRGFGLIQAPRCRL
ncbi:hypothetical protein GOE08_16465 [Sinorhizobium medicae]|nr:hypothetical protein [Sinorhizobium medicae]